MKGRLITATVYQEDAPRLAREEAKKWRPDYSARVYQRYVRADGIDVPVSVVVVCSKTEEEL